MSEQSAAPRRLDDQLFIACGLAWAAGLIHVEAAVEHIGAYLPYTLFFALLAPVQFAWGIALYRRPGRGLLVAGAVLSLMVAAAWIASRTSGLPIGPGAWHPKPVGGLESVATADELALTVLALLQLRSRRATRLARGCRKVGTAGTVYLILLSSMALMPGSPQQGLKGSVVNVPRAGLQLLCHPG